jgi:hypothetical protein
VNVPNPPQASTEPLQVAVTVTGVTAQLTQQQKDAFVQQVIDALDHALRPAAPQPQAAPTGSTVTIGFTLGFKF